MWAYKEERGQSPHECPFEFGIWAGIQVMDFLLIHGDPTKAQEPLGILSLEQPERSA